MPRRARLRVPGITLHVVQRGNNRASVFFGESDFAFYRHHLRHLASRFDCSLHAYVLMTNHVHMLLTPHDAKGMSLLMKHLSQRYVQYVNKVYGRTGSLWEGRYRSCLTQSESYVLACYRYIEMNPVRARMVAHPRDYRWSSYVANASGAPSQWVDPHDEYLRLGHTEADRRAAYRSLFEGTIGADVDAEVHQRIREATVGNIALGDARFQAQVASTVGRRASRGTAGRPRRQTAPLAPTVPDLGSLLPTG
ncbi:MAG: transposase [Betaproteobacteria bacterium]|nr:transposase [Betaproteobacteria bacterium]MDE2002615.1 transposase [Betaproteobacteria bacterium]MDE2358236.1 transposase [Betaproteobacteria bacterium]